jgi:hypothetical protein
MQHMAISNHDHVIFRDSIKPHMMWTPVDSSVTMRTPEVQTSASCPMHAP